MTLTDTGNGYWLVMDDGGVYAFGAAQYLGSLPGWGIVPAVSVAAIVAASRAAQGYWSVGADWGVFNYGAAGFYGSIPRDSTAPAVATPVVGLVPDANGAGYSLVSSSGVKTSFPE
jgi:hypothetical protein